jgi:hypothetical protein
MQGIPLRDLLALSNDYLSAQRGSIAASKTPLVLQQRCSSDLRMHLYSWLPRVPFTFQWHWV